MTDFTITRKIEIDAAHRVPDHGSKCFAIHGHRYVVEATCVGELIDEGEQKGMVMDFGFLKQCMMETIHDTCDHGIILYKNDPVLNEIYHPTEGTATWWKVRVLDCVPTAENLAREWYWEINAAIGNFFAERGEEEYAPTLLKIRVYETPNCWADWPTGSGHKYV